MSLMIRSDRDVPYPSNRGTNGPLCPISRPRPRAAVSEDPEFHPRESPDTQPAGTGRVRGTDVLQCYIHRVPSAHSRAAAATREVGPCAVDGWVRCSAGRRYGSMAHGDRGTRATGESRPI